MRARVALMAGLLSLGACATTTPDTPGTAPDSTPAGDRPTSRLLRPDQIISILDGSKIAYQIVPDEHLRRVDIPDILDRPFRRTAPVDPFVELKREGPEGRLKLIQSRPPATISDLFEQAGSAFEAREFEVAEALYQKAIEVEPDYFKSYTYHGNALFFLGDYARAEQAFVRALEINPIDYQAMLFLGDTYFQRGELQQAKNVLTRAYMLNRANNAVLERLRAVLAKLNLRIRADRLTPAVRIEQISKKGVEIRMLKADGGRWLALAACMACWAYEERCSDRASEEDDPLRLAMYRECMINQAASISVRKTTEDDPLLPDERILLSAIEDGFLDAIIFWEIVAHTAPVVILILPEGLQEMILQYIEKYVFASTQVV